MINWLKKFKPLYWIYNLLHYRQLKHNSSVFKQHGIHKPLFASLSSKDFPDRVSQAWLDKEDSSVAAPQNLSFKDFSSDIQMKISGWSKKGFITLPGFFDKSTCDSINTEIENLIARKKLKFENGNKLMFANKKSRFISDITNTPELIKLLSFLLGKEIITFQTINFITGSGQRGHSDSIHMTTYPLGYLIAVWIALEDVNADNGPLFYYPGSHRLPYVLNDDFNEGETALLTGKKEYTDYEGAVDEMIKKEGLQKEIFLAKKGDAFIWHANLVHGGSPIINEKLTRKSMVIHYFARDVIKYHEITERPSLLNEGHTH